MLIVLIILIILAIMVVNITCDDFIEFVAVSGQLL